MQLTQLTAQHIRDVHTGGNWTCSNLKDLLADISWQEALIRIGPMNNIVTLTYHIHYYAIAIVDVLQGKPLNAKDEFSFNHPDINSEEVWRAFVETVLEKAEQLADVTAQLSDAVLTTTFADEQYGSYYRNLHGFIEHTHYHLGQIALIKKWIRMPIR